MNADEIRARLEALDIGQAEFARQTGIEVNHVHKMLGKQRRRVQADELDRIRAFFDKHERPEAAAPVREVPIIGLVAAGNWREAVQRPSGTVYVADRDTPKRAFALKISGDSMDLIVEDGATVIVDPDDTDLFPGWRYVVANAEGETTFKEYQERPSRLVPCSSNDAHEAIPLGTSEARIVGRVVQYITRDVPRRRVPD